MSKARDKDRSKKSGGADNPIDLLIEAYPLELGSEERRDLLERAVMLAANSDIRTQFLVKRERMNTAVFGGEVEVVLAMFAWCRNLVRERPDIAFSHELLWNYKHVLYCLPSFARVGQNRIDGIADDMAEVYRENGRSLRPVYTARTQVEMRQGKPAEARALWDEAQRHRRDDKADCPACELNHALELLLLEGRHVDMISAAAPILAGTLKCAEVPHTSLPRLMEAYQALGRLEDAENLRARSYSLIDQNSRFIGQVAIHVDYLTTTGQLQQAAEMLTRHQRWLGKTSNDLLHERYARATVRLLRALTAHGAEPVPDWCKRLLDVLNEFHGAADEVVHDAQPRLLADLIAEQGTALASALDARNGNNHYMSHWQDLEPEHA